MLNLLLVTCSAIVGGLCVLIFEHRWRDPRARSHDALAEVLTGWLSAIQVNVNMKAVPELGPDARAQLELVSAADIRAAERTMLVLGPPELSDALAEWERSGKQLASPRGQDALMGILSVMRSTIVPQYPALEDSALRANLFESPA